MVRHSRFALRSWTKISAPNTQQSHSRFALRSWTKISAPNTQQSLTRYPFEITLKESRGRNLSKPHSVFMSWNLLIAPSTSTN